MKEELKKIFGPENVSYSEEDLLCYSLDASELEGTVDAVVWPENSGQISDLMKFAWENNIPVIPRGAGTNLSGGTIPLGGIIVDFSKMKNIVTLGEDYVVCEPGVVLEDLEYQLNKKKKSFPVMPASDKAASIGGCIAEDCAGIRAIKYGSMKDWVTEVEVVLPNGEITTTTEKTYCGSEGIIGLITRAKLGIIDQPETRTLTVYEFKDYDKLQDKVIELSKGDVSAIEFVSESSNKVIDNPMGSANVLVVEFESGEGEVKSLGEVKKVSEHRKSVSTQLALAGYDNVSDPKIPLEKIAKFLRLLEDFGLPSYGHIGVGIIHARSKTRDELKKVYAAAVELGGSAVGEHGVGLIKKGLAKKWLTPLKEKYDPKNLMNPGKVLGGEVDVKTPSFESCKVCGMCRSRCLVFKNLFSESVSPRGKCILHDRDVLSDVFYKCTLCQACERVCPIGVKITDLIRESREKLIESGRSMKANEIMIGNIRRYGNPFGEVEEGVIPKKLYCC